MKTTCLTLLCLFLFPVGWAHATIVQSVDQPVTTKTKTWTHAVKEAGDYQIGLAWIEVIAGKRDVMVEIFKNGKPIKTLSAPVGQVTRLETRIENLIANDRITVTVVPERHPVPEIGKNTFRGPFIGRSFIPDSPGSRSGHGNNIYVEEVTRIGNDRQLRLHIRKDAKGSDNPNTSMKPRIQHALDQGATEFVVPHVKYAHRGGFTRITKSSRVKLSNLRYYGVPHFWLAITHNTGPITLSNVDLQTPHPETELFVSWRDGMHIKNGRWGILIEDGDWDGAAMYDDTFAIYSRAQKAVAVSDNTITLTPTFLHKEFFLWQPGDWASVWTPGQKELRGMSRVVSVEEKTGKNTFHVTLESRPAGSAEGDLVLHEESLNRGSVIRNCRTTDVGTENSSTRFRCVDVIFENNQFEDFHFWFHAGSNGSRPRDIVLRNNKVSDAEIGKLNFDQGLNGFLRGNQLNGVTLHFRKSENMQVGDTRWVEMEGKQMCVQAVAGSSIEMKGKNTRDGSSRLDKWIKVDASSKVK